MDASSEEFVAPGRSDPHRDLPSAPERSSGLTEISDERRQPPQVARLTRTQVAIIDLIAQGRTDKEIAHEAGMSYRTVRTHLERLYELNAVHCRAALVALVVLRRQLAERRDE
jgi:DNA-binding CsgD family transcriptional regulator